MLRLTCVQPGFVLALRQPVRSAHWIWSNGIGRRALSRRAWTSLPSSRARFASDLTHCDSTEAFDQSTSTAEAELELGRNHVRIGAVSRQIAVEPHRPTGLPEITADALSRRRIWPCVRKEDVRHPRTPVARLLYRLRSNGARLHLWKMAKPKSRYVCQACGSVSSRWQGQCADCAEWNTLVQESAEVSSIFAAKHNLQGGGRVIPLVGLETPAALPERLAERARRVRPRDRRRDRSRFGDAGRRRSGHRQVDPAAPGRRAAGERGQQGRLRVGRGIGRAGAAARGSAWAWAARRCGWLRQHRCATS